MTATPRDDARLDEVVRVHGDALHRICLARLGNVADAEDATQETLLRAWRALPAYDSDRPLRPWLATIARNVCNDTHRRRLAEERRRTYDSDVSDDAVEPLLAAERRTVVREALRSLPPRAATVLYLRDVEGWDYARIGDHLDARPGAARTAVTRAREQMRERVKAVALSRDHWPLAGLFGGIIARRRGGVVRMSAHPTLDASAGAGAVEVGGRFVAAVALAAAAVVGAGSVAPERAGAHDVSRPRSVMTAEAERTTGEATPTMEIPVSSAHPMASVTAETSTTPRRTPGGAPEPVDAVLGLGQDLVAPVVADAPLALAERVRLATPELPAAVVDPLVGSIERLVDADYLAELEAAPALP